MATYECNACGAEYESPQVGGARYFHVCAPVHNPAFDAQFHVDEKGDLVPNGTVDPRVDRMKEHPQKRNENVEKKPDGSTGPIKDPPGKDPVLGERMMKRLLVLFLIFTLAALCPWLANAADVKEVCATTTTADVTVVTTAETVVATSAACTVPRAQFTAIIKGSFTITTGASSATYKIRVRRDSVTGTALGDALSRTIQVAAGGVEEVTFMFSEERATDTNAVVYVATIEIASAAANSTVGESYIEVMLL